MSNKQKGLYINFKELLDAIPLFSKVSSTFNKPLKMVPLYEVSHVIPECETKVYPNKVINKNRIVGRCDRNTTIYLDIVSR